MSPGAMSADGTVLVRCAVACPLCGARNSQYRLNPRMFWYGAREIDLQPSDFHCRRGLEGVHPPLFTMWHCTECRFTAEQTDFVTPLEGVLIRLDTVAARLGELRQNDARFATASAALSAGIEVGNPDFFQATKLHLLALLIWDSIGRMVKQDYLTQARYSLLLAWLYRDAPTLDGRHEQTTLSLGTLARSLKDTWPEAPLTEAAALRKSLAYYEATLAIASFTRDPVNDVTTQQRMGRIQIKLEEFPQAYETLRGALIAARQAAAATRQRLLMDTAGTAPAPLGSVERAKLVEQERRLLALADENERLVDTVRELRLNQRAKEQRPSAPTPLPSETQKPLRRPGQSGVQTQVPQVLPNDLGVAAESVETVKRLVHQGS